jgi:hypothetical protein
MVPIQHTGYQNTEINILLRPARRGDHNGIQISGVRLSDRKSIPVPKMLLIVRNKVNGAVDVRIWKNERWRLTQKRI